jgi:V/A-type H+-transporting ATPase subunit I
MMNKVELVVLENNIIPVTEVLAESKAFHLISDNTTGEGAPSGGVSHLTDQWSDWVTTFTDLEQRVRAVMSTLGVDAGPVPSETPYLISPEAAKIEVADLEEETQAPVRELHEEEDRLNQLQQYIEQLRPIANLDIDLKALRTMRYTFTLLGTMPVANIERLQHSLAHHPHQLITLRREGHLATVMLFGTQRDADVLTRAARSAYLNPLKLPTDITQHLPGTLNEGTPAEAIAMLEEEIARTRCHITQYQATLAHMRETRIRTMRHLFWQIHASRTLAKTITRYGRLRYTYLITGWVPDTQITALKQKIEAVSDQIMIEINPPDPAEVYQIPVALENPPLIKSFEGLVTNYGYPRYGELDPTPITALTFPLVFGLMFGDVGHGLILTLAGLLLTTRKIRALQPLSAIGWVVSACGVMSMIFGLLYGSVFGFEDLIPALLFHPLEHIMNILIVAIVSGIAILSLGMLHNILNLALQRQWGPLLFDHHGIAGLIFYWSLVGGAAASFIPSFPLSTAIFIVPGIVAGLAMTFSEALESLIEPQGHLGGDSGSSALIKESTGTYLMRAIFELFETLISLFSNTLSYVRMGAFAVAHGALSLVVFIIAEAVSPGQGLGYWIVLALGNVFVIGFEGMIVGIQTLRLEYYEFFSKFFSGGGIRYRPMTLVSEENG